MKRNDRGLMDYTQFKDQYGNIVVVRRSSLATKRCVWIFCKKKETDNSDQSPHLTVKQAEMVIKALQKFVDGIE